MEGLRSRDNAEDLVQAYGTGHADGLGSLEGSWMRLATPQVAYAYAWGLANIENIVETDGMGDIERILDRIGSGKSTEEALREVLHSDYNDLMQSTAEYLRKTYSH
jgi:hypothetical protein